MIRVFAIFVSLLLFAGCAHRGESGTGAAGYDTLSNTSQGAGGRAMVGGSANSMIAPEDATFLREAAQSGVAEVQMGQLAMQNAQSPELKDFGQKLVSDHTQSNQELMQLASQKGVQVPTVMAARDQQMLQQLSSMKGAEFDRTCDQHAVDAHVRTIRAFKLAAQRSQDPDIKAFAQKTLPILEQHLLTARQLAAGTPGTSSNAASPDTGTPNQK